MDERVLSHGRSSGGGVAGFWSTLVRHIQPSSRCTPFYMHVPGASGRFFGLGLVGPSEAEGRALPLELINGSLTYPLWLRQPLPSPSELGTLLCETANPLCRLNKNKG